MRNYKEYSKKKRESKVFWILMILLVAAEMTLIGRELLREEKIEPDVSYPMVNQYIEWTGAGYGG